MDSSTTAAKTTADAVRTLPLLLLLPKLPPRQLPSGWPATFWHPHAWQVSRLSRLRAAAQTAAAAEVAFAAVPSLAVGAAEWLDAERAPAPA